MIGKGCTAPALGPRSPVTSEKDSPEKTPELRVVPVRHWTKNDRGGGHHKEQAGAGFRREKGERSPPSTLVMKRRER